MRNRRESERPAKLSLGLPVYNGEKHLEIALASLLEQTFEDFEIIVSDNASTDRTSQICADYAAKDSRIRYVRNPVNIGASPNYNQTFHLSRGEFFKWVAHDDYYAPDYLERCLGALLSSPDVVLSHTDIVMIDGKGQPLRRDAATNTVWDATGKPLRALDPPNPAESAIPAQRFNDVLHGLHWCCQVFGVIRSDALRKTGLQRSYYGADKVLLAELALLGRFVQVDTPLFHKRIHAGMSIKLSTSEKRKWIDTKAGFHIPQLMMLRDYFAIAMSSELSVGQKWRCLGSIARLFGRDGVWRKVFVPGPDNYFGINFLASGARPAD